MADVDTEHLNSDRDPHKHRHRVMLMGLIWLAVYPVVTICTYLLSGTDLPTWLRTFLTTILTVPIITYVVVPNAKAAISRLDPKA
jgi:antibiotic biosynthesis monooxygenase (ABM) superfamily enzyme